MSSPITTLQQVMDPRSYPDGASSKLFNGVPRRETLQENSAQPGAVDDYQQARTKIIQDLVLNITRLAWQECSGFPSSQSRGALLGALDDLKLAVESPTDTVLRLVYQPPQNAALRTVVEMGLFRVLLEAQQNQTKNSEVSAVQLAAATGSSKVLVARLMRLMTSMGLCTTTSPETYVANSKTTAFGAPIGNDGVQCIYDLTLPAVSKLPDFLREHNYSNPSDYDTCPMQWAVGKSQFEWLAERPKHQQMFDSYMSSRRQGKKEWFEVYPYYERLLSHLPKWQSGEMSNKQEQEVFIVDVGGNKGHNLQRLVENNQKGSLMGNINGSQTLEELGLPGRLVLQDLPAIIAKAPHIEGVEQMAYSFFDPQPVKGAKVYFFRSIFHDWADQICLQILANTVTAMDPTTSRIIIVDHVLSDIKASLMQTSMDIQMMGIGAGMERSLGHWRQLLAQAGLEIRGVWWGEPGLESVIEAGVVGQ